jgi:hypothetical protein
VVLPIQGLLDVLASGPALLLDRAAQDGDGAGLDAAAPAPADLDSGQREVLGQALADAIEHRTLTATCPQPEWLVALPVAPLLMATV